MVELQRSTAKTHLVSALVLSLVTLVLSVTDSGDLEVLNQLRKNLENPELLQWPTNGGDPCGTPGWKHVFCKNSRVTQIQVQNVGLKGPLPENLNKLSMLENLGLQKNQFSGQLPTFNGLSNLKYAYLDNNNFDSIPGDFFDGLVSLEVLALDYNNFNATTGWSFPQGLLKSAQLTNLSAMSCNLVGELPGFLGEFSSLQNLKLSLNNLSGEIPESFKDLSLVNLWLNNQQGSGFTGPIDVVANIASLLSLWLHGNHFTGTIPESIGNLTSLKDLNLNGNQFVGLIPASLANLQLDTLDLNNNMLMGPIPKFRAAKVTYASNLFCQTTPGALCAPEVMSLVQFLGGLNYPPNFASSWSGNDPCNSWLGVTCDDNQKISVLNLPNYNLSGTLSPSVAKIDSLTQIRLQKNHLTGQIPTNWTSLKSLIMLDLSENNISPPLPKFRGTVKLVVVGNPFLDRNQSGAVPSTGTNPPSGNSDSPPDNPSASTKGSSSGSSSSDEPTKPKSSKRTILVAIVAPVASIAIATLLVIPLSIYYCKKRKDTLQAPSSLVIHPRDPSDSDNMVKIVVASNSNVTTSTVNGSGSASRGSSGVGESHVIEAGNLVISVQVLRNVTKNFAPENELGRGGFGVVYKGELEDGTKIAVKRMESSVISNKALDEFQAEIAVLSKVRHRHLVSLLGYSVEGYERILVYEAKVSDFGLVKLAPDGEQSIVTRLAGTFGYLAPEYAVTGKITTKADVFSFGVVLMELLTGWMALDESRPEESQYLPAWFWQVKSDKEKLRAAIDPALDVKDETFESIATIAELAGHCTAREPGQRPDMGHAVNVLAPLVEKWKPLDDDPEEYCGIDYSLPLNQMVKDWQESEGKDTSYMDLDDSKSSIPAMPKGFAESFGSDAGR
ncbi:hypothetical protein Q3G72_008879 [Acer saccharum]|nr:hypothetical protein Q3G72_008879 [Acer saccharum]